MFAEIGTGKMSLKKSCGSDLMEIMESLHQKVPCRKMQINTLLSLFGGVCLVFFTIYCYMLGRRYKMC